MAGKYDALKAAAEKLSDEELLAEMHEHSLALTVLWRETERREEPTFQIENGFLVGKRGDKHLFVSVYLTDRRGVHVSAFEGRRLREP